jgi:hypothetical protein
VPTRPNHVLDRIQINIVGHIHLFSALKSAVCYPLHRHRMIALATMLLVHFLTGCWVTGAGLILRASRSQNRQRERTKVKTTTVPRPPPPGDSHCCGCPADSLFDWVLDSTSANIITSEGDRRRYRDGTETKSSRASSR